MFKKILGVNLYVFGTVIAGLVLAGILMFAGLIPLIGIPLILLSIVVLLVAALAGALLSLAVYRVVEEQHKTKRKVSVVSVASENTVPFILLLLLKMFIFFVALVPFLLVALIFGNIESPIAVQLLAGFIQAVFLFLGLAIGFFLQFAIYELVLAKKGAWESIKASVVLVKNNFVETLIFFFVYNAIGWIINFAFTIILYVLLIAGILVGGAFFGIASIATLGLGALIALAIIAVIAIVVLLAYIILVYTAELTVTVPLVYRYWTALREPPKKAKKKPVPKSR